ncbi:uncharacterized, partial [Tachysurus ichikawai]
RTRAPPPSFLLYGDPLPLLITERTKRKEEPLVVRGGNCRAETSRRTRGGIMCTSSRAAYSAETRSTRRYDRPEPSPSPFYH